MKFHILTTFALAFAGAEAMLRAGNQASKVAPGVALMHGLSDNCQSSDMRTWTTATQATMQSSFVRCIPLGPTASTDASNTFSLSMQEQVDVFAEEILSSPSFSGGFNAIGFSQGTLIIRGYIQKYAWRSEYPPVFSFMAVHGPLAGLGSFPGVSSALLYSNFIQNSIAPTNYVKDVFNLDGYLTTDFLPYLNKELASTDYQGLEDLEQLVMVKADFEFVISPSESSFFGFYADNSNTLQSFTETQFYEDDTFGLRTLDEAGKVFFETTPGAHYALSASQLSGLLNEYWLPNWKWENNDPIF